VNEREPDVDSTDFRDEELESRPEETSYASGHSYGPITGAHAAPNNQVAFPGWCISNSWVASGVGDELRVTIVFRKIQASSA
jgi:hypothetical protein